jgi:dephospho-CoA kinase
MNEKKTIIGITEAIGSGKDTVADYISEKLKIPAFQISQPLKDLAAEKGIEPNRENLIKLGNEVFREKGPNFFVEVLISKAPENLMIISGSRIPSVLEYMRDNYNLILLGVTADPEIRFERSVLRDKLGEAKNFEEFMEREKIENSPPNAQRIFECLEMSDYTIENNDSLEVLYEKVDKFLKDKSLI